MTPPLYLASASPRRRKMLEDAGFSPIVIHPGVDDAELSPPASATLKPEHWVMALASLKARAARDGLLRGGAAAGTILAADTVCVVDGRILGQPRDEAHAREMLRLMRGRTHRTMTGVCLLPVAEPPGSPTPESRQAGRLPHRHPPHWRLLFVDVAEVHVGDVPDAAIERYVQSGDWRGKAGGYNLSERLEAGWPIECRGDPATVMGLPMRRLLPLLAPILDRRHASPAAASP